MKLQKFLSDLRNDNITVKIVSTSWYPITADQWQEYLFYATDMTNLGFNKDEILAVEDPGPGLSADKGQKIRDDQNIDSFQAKAMFADDSTGNINSALDVCNVVWMKERKGLGKEDMEFITASTS